MAESDLRRLPAEPDLIHRDLARAELYRLLDEVARARSDRRELLILEFEDAWRRFKEVVGPSD
jgi:hypothetical protein